MSLRNNDLLMQNRIFAWIALVTGTILLIPLIAMQFTDEVRWDLTDFVVMGTLLMGTGSIYVLVSRKLPRQRRGIVALIFVIALLYLWAELAVGIFTSWGT